MTTENSEAVGWIEVPEVVPIDFVSLEDALAHRKDHRQRHIAKWRPNNLLPNLTSFEYPEAIQENPRALATCQLLQSLYKQFAFLHASKASLPPKAYNRRQNKMRRDLAPRLLLGLSHLTLEEYGPAEEITTWLDMIVSEAKKLMKYEGIDALLQPYRRRAQILGDHRYRKVQDEAALRSTFKALELLCDTAVFPLNKDLPTFNVESVAHWGWTPEDRAKITKKFFSGAGEKLVRGLDEWNLVLRYCEARKESPQHEKDVECMESILTMKRVKDLIRDIEVLSMSVRLDSMDV